MDLTNSLITSTLPLPPPPLQIPLTTPSFLMDHPHQSIEEEEQPQRGEDYDLMSGWARSLSVSPRLFPTYSLSNNNGNSNASGSGTHNNSFGVASGSGSSGGGGVGSPLLSGRKDLPTVGTGLSPLLGPTHIGSNSNSTLGVGGSSSGGGMLMASGQGGSYDYNTFGQYHTNPPDGIPHHHSSTSTSSSSLHNPFPSHISNHHSPLSESYTNPLLSNNNNNNINNNNNNNNINSNHSHALSYSNLNPISPKLNSTQSFSSSLPPNSNSHSNTQPSPTLNPTALDPTSTLSLSNLAASNLLDQQQLEGATGEEDPRIRAYAKLEFPTFDIYIQKLSVIVGRRPAAVILPANLPASNLPVAVPIPYGALGGGVENPVVRRSPSLSGESGNVGNVIGGAERIVVPPVEEVKLEDFLLGIGEDDESTTVKKVEGEPVVEGGDSLVPIKFEDSTTATSTSTAAIIPNLNQVLHSLPPGLSLTPSSPRGGQGDLTTREEDEDEQRDFSEFLKSSPPPMEIEETKISIAEPEIKKEEEMKVEVEREEVGEPMVMESVIIPSPPPISNNILPSSLTSHSSLPSTLPTTIDQQQQQQQQQSIAAIPAPILTDIDLGPIRAVSRQHARLYFDYEMGGWAIEVLGRNGVVVEGTWKAKGEKEPLGKRTKIQIAERIFYFVLPTIDPPAVIIPTNEDGYESSVLSTLSPELEEDDSSDDLSSDEDDDDNESSRELIKKRQSNDGDSSSLSELSSDSEFGLSPPLNPISSSSSLLNNLPDLPMLPPPLKGGLGKGGKGKGGKFTSGGKGGKGKGKGSKLNRPPPPPKIARPKIIPAIRITSSWANSYNNNYNDGPLFPDQPIMASTSNLSLAPPARAASRGVVYSEGINASNYNYTTGESLSTISGGVDGSTGLVGGNMIGNKFGKPRKKGKGKSTATGKRKVKKIWPADGPARPTIRKGRPPKPDSIGSGLDDEDRMDLDLDGVVAVGEENEVDYDIPLVMGRSGKGKGAGKGKSVTASKAAGKATKSTAAKKIPKKAPKEIKMEEISTNLPPLPPLPPLPTSTSTLPLLNGALPPLPGTLPISTVGASTEGSTSQNISNTLPVLANGQVTSVVGTVGTVDASKKAGKAPKATVSAAKPKKVGAADGIKEEPKPIFPYPIYPEPPSSKTIWAPGTRPSDISEDPNEKPPYSYASLIAQAISCSEDKKLTLQDMYDWIMARWPFFKDNDKGWQNSIRHNLTLPRGFLKIPRKSNEPGKGSYWTVDPAQISLFDGLNYRKKVPVVKEKVEKVKVEKAKPVLAVAATMNGTGPVRTLVPLPNPAFPVYGPPNRPLPVPARPIQRPLARPPLAPGQRPPAPTLSSPLPIIVAPIPDNYVRPTPAPSATPPDELTAALLRDPPIVLHEGRLILNPGIFNHLTKVELDRLQTLAASEALQILQAFVVQHFKDKMRRMSIEKERMNQERVIAARLHAARLASLQGTMGPNGVMIPRVVSTGLSSNLGPPTTQLAPRPVVAPLPRNLGPPTTQLAPKQPYLPLAPKQPLAGSLPVNGLIPSNLNKPLLPIRPLIPATTTATTTATATLVARPAVASTSTLPLAPQQKVTPVLPTLPKLATPLSTSTTPVPSPVVAPATTPAPIQKLAPAPPLPAAVKVLPTPAPKVVVTPIQKVVPATKASIAAAAKAAAATTSAAINGSKRKLEESTSTPVAGPNKVSKKEEGSVVPPTIPAITSGKPKRAAAVEANKKVEAQLKSNAKK